jgi:hypothetical protein
MICKIVNSVTSMNQNFPGSSDSLQMLNTEVINLLV